MRWRSSRLRTALRRLRSTAACSNSCSSEALLHALVEGALDLAVAAGEEVDDRVDVLAVLLLGDVADAGGLAALDEVVEAGAAAGAAGLGAVAGAVLEDLAEQVERLAHALGVAERAEVGAPAAVALAREVDARVVLVEADADVGVRLVVAQPDVVDGPVALDELLLGEQRLGLGLGRDELDVADLADHRGARAAEVAADALADRERLADVEDLAAPVAEQVDARGVGQGPALLGEAALGALSGLGLGGGQLHRGYAAAGRPQASRRTTDSATQQGLSEPSTSTVHL